MEEFQNNERYTKHIGKVLEGRYQLTDVIGEGSSAVVFRADDLRTGRPVAVKVLKPEHSKDIKAVKRFENECKAVSMLSHNAIVRVVDISISDSSKYIVMEYIDGITLRHYMDVKGALTFEEIMDFCEQILSGLEHAHSKGIIHRDIKPQNIMLLPKGEVRITDFGIAQVNDDTFSMTNDNAAGTAYYISPEQASGDEVDARSDIYSLGVLMYEMATGCLPFDGDDPIEVAKLQITGTPVPPSQIKSDIPRGLEAMILMAMEKEPGARFKDAGEMLKYLYRIKSRPYAIPRISETRKKKMKGPKKEKSKPTHSMTPVVWGVASALLFLAIICGYYVMSVFFFGESVLVSMPVPDLVGSLYTEGSTSVQDKLDAKDQYFYIKPGNVVYEYDENSAPNQIIAQTPKGGTYEKVIADTQKCEIKIVVSLGPKTNILGDYSMLERRSAELLLRQRGYVVEIQEEENSLIQAGIVIRTVPAEGTELLEGSTVRLIVSSGYSLDSHKIPNFVGDTEVNAAKRVEELGIKVGKVTYTRSSLPVGIVLTQSVNEGSFFNDPEMKIHFVVSGGSDYKTNYIPDVSGLTKNAAQALLWRFGITVGKFEIEKSAEETNTVLRQTPVAGYMTTDVDVKTVNLVLSGGPDYFESLIVIRIPYIEGMTLDEARNALTESYATVGKIYYRYDPTVPEGSVIKQRIEAGSHRSGYPYKIEVDIIVSIGPSFENETYNGYPWDTVPPVTQPVTTPPATEPEGETT